VRSGGYFAGVLGWPLSYTLSPTIHNAAFRRLGLDWFYYAWPVAPEDLEAAVGGIRVLGAMGANVTMPHKEPVMDFVDEISKEAEEVRAVNTIQRFGDKLIGHNTDVDGFRTFLEGDAGVSAEGRSALVLGAGGAARAVVKALSHAGAGQVNVASRNAGAGTDAAKLASEGAVIDWESANRAAADADIIVNATPVGSDGNNPLPDAAFRPSQVIVDLLYRPPTTPLMRAARSAGADAWGGLGMLVHQGAASIRLWTGKDPALEVMSAAALHALGSGRAAASTHG
jgi:shikimate dehydrogenase